MNNKYKKMKPVVMVQNKQKHHITNGEKGLVYSVLYIVLNYFHFYIVYIFCWPLAGLGIC